MNSFVFPLDSPPRRLTLNKIGAYVMTHCKSGHIYVGSTSDLYKRFINHEGCMRRKAHQNKRLEDAYDDDPHFDVLVFITDDKEQAIDKEQELIDLYLSKGITLFNVSTDARVSGLNHSVSKEHREMLRNLRLGSKMTDETKEKIRRSLNKTHRTDKFRSKARDKALEKMKDPEVMERRRYAAKNARRTNLVPVIIHGHRYKSFSEAAESLGVNISTIRSRCRSKNPEFSDWLRADS